LSNPSNNKFGILPYLLILPTLIWLGSVIFYPIFEGIRLSLYDVKGVMIGEKYVFLGLKNYADVLSDPYFWKSLRITLIYTLALTCGSISIGFVTALILNERFHCRGIARTLFIIPWAIPYVAAILVWRWILDYNFGVLNYFLKVLHLTSKNIGWYLEPNYALFSVILIAIWKEFPLATVMFLAGLQAIPTQQYEAAEIDGCGYLAKLRFITLPSLSSISKILILLTIIWSFRRVTVIYVLTQGGPSRATETLVIKTFNEAFSFFRMGYGSAIGTTMLILTLIFSAVYMFIFMRQR
jgi:multiple sugar transport system permease protein